MQERLKKEQEEKEHKKKEKAEAHLYTIIKVRSSWAWFFGNQLNWALCLLYQNLHNQIAFCITDKYDIF